MGVRVRGARGAQVRGLRMSDDAIRAVEVRAELRQLKTKSDGSVDWIFNVPEFCIPQTKVVLDWLQCDLRLVVENDNITQKGGD